MVFPGVRERTETVLGAYLKKRMARKGMTSEELADTSGVSRTTIDAWLRSAEVNPRIWSLKLVADALLTPVEHLARAAVGLEPDPAGVAPEPDELKRQLVAIYDAKNEEEQRLLLDMVRAADALFRYRRERPSPGA